MIIGITSVSESDCMFLVSSNINWNYRSDISNNKWASRAENTRFGPNPEPAFFEPRLVGAMLFKGKAGGMKEGGSRLIVGGETGRLQITERSSSEQD